MTTQSPETIILDGQKRITYNLPLDTYTPLPKFYAMTSVLWRGYRGTWEVRNKELYLLNLFGTIEHPIDTETTYHTRFNFETNEFEPFAKTKPKHLEIDIKNVFPDAPRDGVFASWFSGEINIPQGEIILRGLNNKYEDYLTLSFKNGILESQVVRSYTEVFSKKS